MLGVGDSEVNESWVTSVPPMLHSVSNCLDFFPEASLFSVLPFCAYTSPEK